MQSKQKNKKIVQKILTNEQRRNIFLSNYTVSERSKEGLDEEKSCSKYVVGCNAWNVT